MIDIDCVKTQNKKGHSPNWPQILDHSLEIL